MNVLLLIVHALIFFSVGYLIWKYSSGYKLFFVTGFVFKLIMGICVGLIYTYYYTVGDTFAYVHDGNIIASVAQQNIGDYVQYLINSSDLPGLLLSEPRALFFSKFVSVFSLLTNGNYWIICLYFSMFSFLGCWYFVQQIEKHLPDITLPAIISFLFFPSFVFWTSGVIKESIAIGAIAFLAGIFIRLWFSSRINIAEWMMAIVAVWMAWNIKYYFTAVFCVVSATSIVFKLLAYRYVAEKPVTTQVVTWLILFCVPLLVVSFLHPNFYPEKFFGVISDNYQEFQKLSDPGEAIQFKWMEMADFKMLLNSPWALVSGLYRPFVWEARTVFQGLVASENLLLLILTVAAVFSLKRMSLSSTRLLLFTVVVYVSVLCIFLCLSTPNFGTLSRYRSGFLPFFLLLLLSSPFANGFIQRSVNHLAPTKR
jgi:hypothetical protein